MKPASEQQVGGNHYKDFVIQPAEFIHKNGIGFLEGNVIKYVCRHATKNGKDDLLKARHYIDLLLEWQYPEPAPEYAPPYPLEEGLPQPLGAWVPNQLYDGPPLCVHGRIVCRVCNFGGPSSSPL